MADIAHIDENLAQRLVSSQFPQWAKLPLTPVEPQGHDNRTFRLREPVGEQQIEEQTMWKDWVNIVLGLWLAASPWVIGGPAHAENVAMVWNCVLTGGGIVAFAGWAAAAPKEVWQEWTVVLLGVWLLIAPNTLSNDIPVLTWNNVAVGLAAAILAIWRIFKVDIQETTTGPK